MSAAWQCVKDEDNSTHLVQRKCSTQIPSRSGSCSSIPWLQRLQRLMFSKGLYFCNATLSAEVRQLPTPSGRHECRRECRPLTKLKSKASSSPADMSNQPWPLKRRHRHKHVDIIRLDPARPTCSLNEQVRNLLKKHAGCAKAHF